MSAMAGYHGSVLGTDGKADRYDRMLDSPRRVSRQPSPYAYYWHGHQVLLRPALVSMTYGEIRYPNLMCWARSACRVVRASEGGGDPRGNGTGRSRSC